MDVNIILFHGNLAEEMYIEQPKEFVVVWTRKENVQISLITIY